MKILFQVVFVSFLLLIQASCGGGTSSPGNITSGALFVSQINGSNSGDGTKKYPYKTISYALSQLGKKSTLYVSGGKYSTDNEEIFPLVLNEGVRILTFEEPNNSGDVVIEGFGEDDENNFVSLIFLGRNQLNSLIISSMNNIGVLIKSGENEIINSNIKDNKVAIGVTGKSKISLVNTLVNNNSHAGIEASGVSLVNLVASKINNNNIGVIISEDSKIDFEINQSSQNNEIMKNVACDFFHEGSKTLQLREIKWDDDVFDFSISKDCSNGNNIVNIGSASIDYQYIPSQKNTLFVADRIINIVSPTFGDTIYSTAPDFVYNTTGNKLIMIALWETPAIVRDNVIINMRDIVWFWHSGMKNSPIGAVSFTKGQTPLNGNLNPTDLKSNPPKPLDKGRSYYFAIWEWDEMGIKILGSSKESYFKVTH